MYVKTGYKDIEYPFFIEYYDETPFNHEAHTGDDDIPTLNDILAASFVNVSYAYISVT